MEDLTTEAIKITIGGKPTEYLVREKDHGDLVVFDILREDHYLLTLSKEGDILFMNFAAEEAEKEIFKLSCLNQFIEQIKALS
jgi:hypothetical protein